LSKAAADKNHPRAKLLFARCYAFGTNGIEPHRSIKNDDFCIRELQSALKCKSEREVFAAKDALKHIANFEWAAAAMKRVTT
jgi:hypothetical protein